MNDKVKERDYTGVAVNQMASVYERYTDCDIRTFAQRIQMDESTLKHILVTKDYPFVGLGTVDKIVLGLGQSLNTLTESGELTIIPARGSRAAARRMIEDTLVLKATEHIGTIESARMTHKEALGLGLLRPIREEQMHEMIIEMLRLRGELAMKTPEQAERLRRDSERLAKKSAEGKAA